MGEAARFETTAGGIGAAGGEAATAGGGTDFPFDLEPQDTSNTTVGGKCLEVEPINPEAAIFDLSDFGCDLAGCEAIDAHDVVFWELMDAKDGGPNSSECRASMLRPESPDSMDPSTDCSG